MQKEIKITNQRQAFLQHREQYDQLRQYSFVATGSCIQYGVESSDTVVPYAHAQIEGTSDDSKDCNCQELQQAFGHFPKYQKKFLLRDFNLKINKSGYFETGG